MALCTIWQFPTLGDPNHPRLFIFNWGERERKMVFLFEKPSICMFVRELVGGQTIILNPIVFLDDRPNCFMHFYGVESPTSLVFVLDITHHVPSFQRRTLAMPSKNLPPDTYVLCCALAVVVFETGALMIFGDEFTVDL